MKNFLAAVYEAENEGSDCKILNVKAKAMTVGKIIDEKQQNNLKDLNQQIESLATIMKSATLRGVKSKVKEGVSSPGRKRCLGTLLRKGYRDHLGKERYLCDQGRNLSNVIGVMVRVRDGENAQYWKMNWRVVRCSSLKSWKSWLHSYTNTKSKSMIYRILRQSDLYH